MLVTCFASSTLARSMSLVTRARMLVRRSITKSRISERRGETASLELPRSFWVMVRSSLSRSPIASAMLGVWPVEAIAAIRFASSFVQLFLPVTQPA